MRAAVSRVFVVAARRVRRPDPSSSARASRTAIPSVPTATAPAVGFYPKRDSTPTLVAEGSRKQIGGGDDDDDDDDAAVAVLLARLAALANEDEGDEDASRALAGALRRGVNERGIRGLYAARTLQPGETVLQVPLSLAITDDPSARVNSPERNLTWSRQLCRALVQLRRRAEDPSEGQSADCIARLYYATLPRDVVGLANDAAVADDALEEIFRLCRCAESAAETRRHRSTLAAALRAETPVDASPSSSTHDADWRWATSMVHSRTFRLEDESGGSAPTTRAMVPGADIVNHSSVDDDVNAEWIVLNQTYFVVRTTRRVAFGRELLMKYGDQSDGHFLLHHGFLPERNPHNAVTLFTDAQQAVSWYRSRYLPPAAAAADDADAAFLREAERAAEVARARHGKYALDPSTGLRRLTLGSLDAGADGAADAATTTLFRELCGDVDFAAAAVGARAAEAMEEMLAGTEEVERALRGVNASIAGLVREYRARKLAILARASQCVDGQ